MVDISIQSSHEKEKAKNICLYLLLIMENSFLHAKAPD